MITTEPFCRGRIRICQHKQGYRFSVDSAILAHHVSLHNVSTAVDLGTGCGVIPLILAHRFPSVHVYGIEIQESLAHLAMANVRLNNMEDRITIIHGDMKDPDAFVESQATEVVISNPPYRKIQSGKMSPNCERAIARHEVGVTLTDVIACADRLLRPLGRLVLVYSAERLADLITRMRAFRIEPKTLRFVHTKPELPAELVLARGLKHGRAGVSIAPSLVIHKTDGGYTDEARAMMEMG